MKDLIKNPDGSTTVTLQQGDVIIHPYSTDRKGKRVIVHQLIYLMGKDREDISLEDLPSRTNACNELNIHFWNMNRKAEKDKFEAKPVREKIAIRAVQTVAWIVLIAILLFVLSIPIRVTQEALADVRTHPTRTAWKCITEHGQKPTCEPYR